MAKVPQLANGDIVSQLHGFAADAEMMLENC
jgi:hypothetical protein